MDNAQLTSISFPSDKIEETIVKHATCPHCNSTYLIFKQGDYPNLEFECLDCDKGKNLELTEILSEIEPCEMWLCPECDGSVINSVCFDCGFELDPNIDYERQNYLLYLMEKND